MSVRLPQAPEQYDILDQNNLRSKIEEILARLLVSNNELTDGFRAVAPAGSMEFLLTAGNAVTLRVTPSANTLSFGYTVGTTNFDLEITNATTRNFVDGSTPFDQSLGTLDPGDALWVVVWFYEGAGGIGDVSDPIGRKYQPDILEGSVGFPSFAATIRPPRIVDELPISGDLVGDLVFLTTDFKLYRWTGTEWTVEVEASDVVGELIAEQIADAAITTAKFAAGIRPVRIVSSLPGAGDVEGDVVYLTTDNKLYRWDGSAWTSAVPTTDLTGQVVNAQIADAAVSTAKFAAGIRPVRIVASLPGSGDVEGDTVYLTTDNKLYRWDGSAWTSAVPTSDLTGTISTTQLADGAVTTVKLGDAQVTTAKIGDAQVTNTKLGTAAVTTTKIADGHVTEAKIGDNQVTSNKIGTGAVTTAKIGDSQVTTAKIGDSQVTTLKIGDTAVTTAKLLDSAVSSAKLANTSVLASKLSAAARTQHGVFMEIFEDFENWSVLAGTGVGSIETGDGVAGGKVYRSVGYQQVYSTLNIPYDPSKLYRMRARVRRTAAATDPTKDLFYCGFRGIGADGSTSIGVTGPGGPSHHYVVASGVDMGAAALDEWQEITGWFSGHSDPGNANDRSPTSPYTPHEDVRYIRPLFFLNYNGGDGTMEMDYIVIDVFDEDSLVRTYLGLNVDGVVAADKVVADSILAGSILTAKLAAGAVTADKIAASTITAAQIAAGTITATQIASGTITAAQIAAATITADKLVANSITAGQIAAGAIGASEIAADAIATTKLVAGFRNFLSRGEGLNAARNFSFEDGSAFWAFSNASVVTDSTKAHTGNKYVQVSNPASSFGTASAADEDGGAFYTEVDEGDVLYFGGWAYRESGDANAYLQLNAYDKDKLNPNFPTTTQLSTSGAWTQLTGQYTVPAGKKYVRLVAVSSNLGTGTTVTRFDDLFLHVQVAGASIVAGSITTNHMTANTINGDRITAGTLAADKLVANSITAGQIASGAVNTDELAANAVTAAKIAAGTITANEIAALTITGAKIAAGTITADKLVANSITAGQIAAGAITADEIAAGVISATHFASEKLSSISDPTNKYIDFGATTTEPFIKHPAFELLANGDATFTDGDIVMSTGGGQVIWKEGSTTVGLIEAYYDAGLPIEQGMTFTVFNNSASPAVMRWMWGGIIVPVLDVPGDVAAESGFFDGDVEVTGNLNAATITGSYTVDASTLVGTTLASNVVSSSLTSLGTLTALNVSGATTLSGTGQVINMTGSSKYITYSAAGVGAPTTTTRSVGTKIVLYPGVSSTNVDYGMGIESSSVWFSVPSGSSAQHFYWYGGTTRIMDLVGNGILNLSGGSAALQIGGTTVISTARALENITSLQVDNININGNTISSTAGTDLLITPLAGQQIVLDGTIVIDAGVVTGATSITSTTFVGALSGNATSATSAGNATTATTLQTARTINGVSFNGSANITVPAAAGTLTGATLAAGVTASSLTSVGTLTALTVSGNTTLGSATNPVLINRLSDSTTYGAITFNGSLGSTAMLGVFARAADNALYYIAQSGGHVFRNAGAALAGIGSSGMTVVNKIFTLGAASQQHTWATWPSVIELGQYNGIMSDGGNARTYFLNGAYYDGSWKYSLTSVPPLLYQMSEVGTHYFYNAPTGTAGNVISWVELAHLDGNGITAIDFILA